MARDGMLSALFLDCGWKEKKIGDASLFSQVLGAINCHSADVRSGLDDLLLHKEGGKGVGDALQSKYMVLWSVHRSRPRTGLVP